MDPQNAFCTPTSIVLTAPSDFGHLAVAVASDALVGVSMANASALHGATRLARMLGETLEPATLSSCDENERLALAVLDRLCRYLDGEPVAFDDVPVSLDHLSTFQRRVVACCRAIPYGGTRTYGELAAAAGSPGAARAVGQVMACNRLPLVVPCHRVLAAGGKLGGFSAPQGLALKRRLLALETGNEGRPRPASVARGRQRSFV
jgi:methylated-DNA-[protein]-cysteine S-methyltransferase